MLHYMQHYAITWFITWQLHAPLHAITLSLIKLHAPLHVSLHAPLHVQLHVQLHTHYMGMSFPELMITCCLPSQSSSVSFQSSTLAATPPLPSSITGLPLFRYVFNAVLRSSRCSAWNLTRLANNFSRSGLGNFCGSKNRNVRWCTSIKKYGLCTSIKHQ